MNGTSRPVPLRISRRIFFLSVRGSGRRSLSSTWRTSKRKSPSLLATYSPSRIILVRGVEELGDRREDLRARPSGV